MIDAEKQGIERYRDLSVLNQLDNVNYAFSPRNFGNMAFAYGELNEIIANRRSFLAAAGIELEDVVFMRPVHKVNIEIVEKKDKGKGALEAATAIPSTDALITTEKGVALALNPADCAPVIITNKKAEFLALYHAGRDGTDLQIGSVVISKLIQMGFTDVDTFMVGIGPLIKRCCYGQQYLQTHTPKLWNDYLAPEVGWQKDTDRINSLEPPLYKITARSGSRLNLDLAGVNWEQLVCAGVHNENISITSFCTACEAEKDLIFSHVVSSRYEGTVKAHKFPEGRFMAVAQLKA